jgi:hypothetical protein
MSKDMASYPSEQRIRAALVARVDRFVRTTGTSRSEVGRRALNDTPFVAQVCAGRNFTIGSYARVMAWLDAADWTPRRAVKKSGRKR